MMDYRDCRRPDNALIRSPIGQGGGKGNSETIPVATRSSLTRPPWTPRLPKLGKGHFTDTSRNRQESQHLGAG